MDTEQARQLEAVARLGTISAAADELHISQPALSRSISRFERDLGYQLLDRKGRSVTLNQAGEIALEYLRPMLRDERLMLEALDALASQSSSLTVASAAPAPVHHLVLIALQNLPDQLLSTRLIRTDRIESMVADGEAALGISTEPAHHPALMSHHLMDERLFVALPATHPLASQASVTFAQIDGETFLLQEAIGFWGDVVCRCMPHARFAIQSDRDIYLKLAEATDTPLFISDAGGPIAPPGGRVSVPIADAQANPSFYLLVRRDATGAARKLFSLV